MASSTDKFQRALPAVLLAASPALAALHAARTRIHNLTAISYGGPSAICERCGTFLLDGSSQTRTRSLKVNRKGGAGSGAALVVVCAICKHETRTLLRAASKGVNGAAAFPPVRKHVSLRGLTEQAQDLPPAALPSPSPPIVPRTSPSVIASAAPTPSPAVAPASRPRTAKSKGKSKTGLQALLARNRETERLRREGTSGAARAKGTTAASLTGLAAFLEDLQ